MHYTLDEWRLFADHSLDDETERAMEEHLLVCDQCLERYLSCITEESICSAEEVLSPSFTAGVMYEVDRYVTASKKNRRNKLILYYAAVACITLFLTGTGMFYRLMDEIPRFSERGTADKIVLNIELGSIVKEGWSDKLMDKTLSIIDTLKPQQ